MTRRRDLVGLAVLLMLLHFTCALMVTGYVTTAEHDLTEGGGAPPAYPAMKLLMDVLLAPILPLVFERSRLLIVAFPLNSLAWGVAGAWLWKRALRKDKATNVKS
jgi:hypothetical protein